MPPDATDSPRWVASPADREGSRDRQLPQVGMVSGQTCDIDCQASDAARVVERGASEDLKPRTLLGAKRRRLQRLRASSGCQAAKHRPPDAQSRPMWRRAKPGDVTSQRPSGSQSDRVLRSGGGRQAPRAGDGGNGQVAAPPPMVYIAHSSAAVSPSRTERVGEPSRSPVSLAQGAGVDGPPDGLC